MTAGRDRRRGGPPDYVGVGSVGSGAAWWHDMLLRHPAVQSRRKGRRALQFFGEFCTREMTEADVAAYHRRFRRRREGRVTGEWSPRYMSYLWTAPLIRRAAPDARVIVLLSDPIERYRSRLARDRQRVGDERPDVNMADPVLRGRYVAQLRALTEHFPPEQVLVLQFEKCRADPFGQYARTLRFLGLDDDFVPRKLRRQHAREFGPPAPVRALRAAGLPIGGAIGLARKVLRRPGPVRPAELWPELDAALHDEYDADVTALRDLVPEFDAALWPQFAPGAPAPPPA